MTSPDHEDASSEGRRRVAMSRSVCGENSDLFWGELFLHVVLRGARKRRLGSAILPGKGKLLFLFVAMV